jgi:fructose-specific phosphotransferase system IIC component
MTGTHKKILFLLPLVIGGGFLLYKAFANKGKSKDSDLPLKDARYSRCTQRLHHLEQSL